MIPRFHCPFELHPGARAPLPETAAHHALKVLRLATGAPVEVFDGRGGAWRARIEIAGKRVFAQLLDFDPEDHEPPLAITLAQCLPSGDKMDYVVQKAVEIGVARIAPVLAKRSVVRLSGERMTRRLEHWRGIAIAACEQCGRNRVPVIEPLLDLPQYLAQAQAQNQPRWICQPEGGTRLRAFPAPGTAVTLFIGPEGGFDDDEVRAAHAAGFVPLRLGSRVLRTETAGPAAIAAILALWGDW